MNDSRENLDVESSQEENDVIILPDQNRDEVICLTSDDDDEEEVQQSFEEIVRSTINESFGGQNLFFEDKSTKFSVADVPIYTISASDTLYGDLGSNDNTANSTTIDLIDSNEVKVPEQEQDDSVVFVLEEQLDRRPEVKNSYIPLPSVSSN